MFIELVDSLRCVESHEDTWLVASVWRMDGRHIVDGVLGCPVCRREYAVRGGVGWFTDASATSAVEDLTPAGASADANRVARAAALLGLSEGGGTIVLGGHWVECADALADLGAAHVVLANTAPSPTSVQEVSAIVVGDRLPFAAGTLRGVALSGDAATPARIASAAQSLRPRGRLVAPATIPLPDGVSELARDAVDWVAERTGTVSPPVPVRLARR
jgi:hypothetical protein